MLCCSCHGQHFIIRAGAMIPCPECGGMGGIHCCDGLTAQPDEFDRSSEDRDASELSAERQCERAPSLMT